MLVYNLASLIRTLTLTEGLAVSAEEPTRKTCKDQCHDALHGRYAIFQMAKVAVLREVFAEILPLIDRVRPGSS